MYIDWHQFLAQQYSSLHSNNEIPCFLEAIKVTYMTDLSHFGTLSVSGPEAKKFLQGQFSNDINNLSITAGQSSCCCTPKGNVIANFDLLEHDDHIYIHF